MPPVMEFPEDIPAITVEGTPITEEAFPRRKQRRFAPDADCSEVPEFCKDHEEHLDYSTDMSRVLDEGEFVICASAWSNAPTELVVTRVRYAGKGVTVFVHSGTARECYLVTIHARTNRHRVFTYRIKIKVTCHEFDTLPQYEPPTIFEEGESCDCSCNFYVDLLDAYVGPFYWDANDAPLFACLPADEIPDGDEDGEGDGGAGGGVGGLEG